MFAGKPIIGIIGGIGSGKSVVAKLFEEMGCVVIDSDRQVREAYEREDVKRALRHWWGEGVFDAGGRVNRAEIARRVFAEPAERVRLEALIHPIVAEMREEVMRRAAGEAGVVAFVWDSPLLIEAGLAGKCDAVVFVEAPQAQRMARVMASRGWTEGQWRAREKSQLPLDKKRKVANYMVDNTADDASAACGTAGMAGLRDQVRQVLSRILAGTADEGLSKRPRG